MEKQASTAGELEPEPFNGGYLLTPDSAVIALAYATDVPGQQRANARRIAQCWNSHDDMLAALKQAETYLASRVVGTGGEGERVVLPAVRAAIQKAQGSEL